MPPMSQLLKWHVLLTKRLIKIESHDIGKPLVNNEGIFILQFYFK